MTERPILMSAESVRAIRAGRKTQTRRPVKPQPVPCCAYGEDTAFWTCGVYPYPLEEPGLRKVLADNCPYPVGSRLWVRETWRPVYLTPRPRTEELSVVQYAADGSFNRDDWGGVVLGESWHPSIFLPRRFSRILLEVTENRAERLWDITEADADAEGFNGDFPDRTFPTVFTRGRDYYSQFSMSECFGILWDSINGKRYPWASNPWVWPITFKVLEVKR